MADPEPERNQVGRTRLPSRPGPYPRAGRLPAPLSSPDERRSAPEIGLECR